MPEYSTIPWRRVSVEAAAIVASILLAFAIQAWWEQRNETDRELRILSALLQEFEQNDRLLKEARAYYEARYMEALHMLDYVGSKSTERDEAEFGTLLRGLLTVRSSHLETGAHDGLLAAGELSIIQDEALRSRLAAWPSYVSEWSEEDLSVFSFVNGSLLPALSEHIQLRSINRPFAPFPDGKSLVAVPVGSIEDSLSVIAESQEFDNLVYRRAQGLWYATRDAETLRARLAEILDLIRQNLDE